MSAVGMGTSSAGEMTRVVVEEAQAGQRLDRVLADELAPRLSRSRIQALILTGQVTESGRTIGEAGRRVKPGEVYILNVPPPEPAEPVAEDLPLAIAYEDDDLIVIDKPAGMVVHPAAGHATGTLVNALIAHCGESLSGIGGVRRPGIVHRLDKDTTGLIVVAKTDVAHAGLTEQFQSHGADGRLSRTYVALVWGVPTPRVGTIDAPLGRSTSNRLKIAVRRGEDGRHAVTHYEVVRSFAGRAGTPCVSEVRLHLETGRTHQIRVHMGHIGHPLLGDPVYGTGFNSSIDKLPESAAALLRNLGRQALHAAELGFEHPTSGRPLHFVSPVPADIGNLITALDRGGGSQYGSRG